MGFDPVETCISVTVRMRNLMFRLEKLLGDIVNKLQKLNRIRTVSVRNQ